MKIVLRADASRLIGVGHVMRSMTLGAAAVQRGHAVELHSKTLPALLSERARDLGIELVEVIAAGTPHEADGLLKTDADLICLDGYDFERGLLDSLRSARGALMAIDDNREMPLDHIDVILNQNAHASPELYADLEPWLVLVGPQFALVRHEITALRQRQRVQSKPIRILVSMGGTDPAGLTLPLIEMLVQNTDLVIDVALGVDNANADDCRMFASRSTNRVNVIRSEDLPVALARGDLALLAAGSTLWEAATLGVPTVAIVVAANQMASASAAADRGALIVNDATGGCDFDAVSRSISALAADRDRRRQMARAARTLIDGQGRTRVLHAIEAITRSIPTEAFRHGS
jgi:UDP-2,4-diacetamido-2,4,6-trideoxy-beta-L-altropyranose hydrolase